jgi:transcriptional regulator with XRE-family HTH domain
MAKRRTRPVHPLLVVLRDAAKRRGWTAYRLAQETGLGINTVQRLLAGASNPSLDTLTAAAKALHVTIEAIPS